MARRKKPEELPDGMKLRGKVYYAWFTAHGRTVRKRLSTDYRVACEALNKLKADADRADFGLLDNGCLWTDLKAEFLRWARQSIRIHNEYETDLKDFEAYRKVRTIREIDAAYVMGFREWRLAGNRHENPKAKRKPAPVTPRTVNKQVNTLRSMLNKGVEWKRIGSNPVAGVKALPHDSLAKERRALTAEEVERLFATSPDYLKPVWRAFMVTGMRLDELVELTFADVDFEGRAIKIRANVAKSRKAREIPLDDETYTTIADLRDKAKGREPVPGKTDKLTEQQKAKFSRDHVFVTNANTPWRNNLLRRFYSCCKRAGIDDAHRRGAVDIHSLRVSFATLSLDNGANPKAVQAVLGHSTLDLTMKVYAKATDRAKRDAIAALPFAKVSAPSHVISLPQAHKMRTSPQETPTGTNS